MKRYLKWQPNPMGWECIFYGYKLQIYSAQPTVNFMGKGYAISVLPNLLDIIEQDFAQKHTTSLSREGEKHESIGS
jgi:hypothetical protein